MVASAVTPGESLSHASIYNAQAGTVIEAVSGGVREIPLAQLVDRNHYVIVVRPSNMSVADQRDALARARSKVGSQFDITGMFGIDCEVRPDGFSVEGRPDGPLSAGAVHAAGDHRIAMAGVVAGLVANGQSVIDDADNVATSYPGFAAALTSLGATITSGPS